MNKAPIRINGIAILHLANQLELRKRPFFAKNEITKMVKIIPAKLSKGNDSIAASSSMRIIRKRPKQAIKTLLGMAFSVLMVCLL